MQAGGSDSLSTTMLTLVHDMDASSPLVAHTIQALFTIIQITAEKVMQNGGS